MYFNDDTILYLDGKFLKAKDTAIGLYGQSLHYGYAAFEGIRSYKTQNGTRIFKAAAHYDRLQASCEAVHIPYKWDRKDLIDATYDLLKKNNFQDAYVRPLVFCPPNMSLQKAADSSIMIAVWEWGAYLGDKLLKVGLSTFQRPNPKAFMMQAKISGHYVNSIMACQEAKDNGYDEALLTDIEGYVAEGPGANVFYEKEGRLYTPAPGNILTGITRATVMEICRTLGIIVEERKITVEELRDADAVFYCGTAAEIIGWESLDGVGFKKDWKESLGKIIQQAYKDLVLERQSTLQDAVL